MPAPDKPAPDMPEQDLHRFKVFLAHFVEHVESHIGEIRARSVGVPAGSRLGQLLDIALYDMDMSRQSLDRIVDYLGGPGTAHEHGHRHGHEHGHDHHHD